MAETIHNVVLAGCSPMPLAHYLKALGILRVVSEQVDRGAMGWWQDEVFHLRSVLDDQALTTFFLEHYSPSALIAPWNGGSGFFPKDNQTGIGTIENSTAPRLRHYAEVIKRCRGLADERSLDSAPKDGEKERLLTICRGVLPDDVIVWLDAAFALTQDGPKYPPLLGTGGNDGRLDFTNNFMQRVVNIIDAETGGPTAESPGWLQATLVSEKTSGLLLKEPIGQFLPGSAGGPNAAADFDGESLTNPWDFILMLEGALVFSGAITRRMQATGPGVLSYPFTVRTADAGYGTAAAGDVGQSRAETWMPLWERPAGYREVEALFCEGRAAVGRRRARDGVDFARAVRGLGVDRGISAFERFGYLQRNGQAYIAAPLGRWIVPRRASPRIDLLNEIDSWLDSLERVARGKNAPASLGRAVRRIKNAILEVCRHDTSTHWQEVIVALGAAEKAMVHSPKTVQDNSWLAPLPPLGLGWLRACDDSSPEFRLALSLASIREDEELGPLRANMVPLAPAPSRPRFNREKMDQPFVVWGYADLCENMIATLRRRCMAAQRRNLELLPLHGVASARLDDISGFIYGEVNEQKLEALLWGLNGVRIRGRSVVDVRGVLPASYSLLKLVHLPHSVALGADGEAVAVPYEPEITRLACAGRMVEATTAAARRLRGSGLPPAVEAVTENSALSRRIAAALLFPISRDAVVRLQDQVLMPSAVESPAT